MYLSFLVSVHHSSDLSPYEPLPVCFLFLFCSVPSPARRVVLLLLHAGVLLLIKISFCCKNSPGLPVDGFESRLQSFITEHCVS